MTNNQALLKKYFPKINWSFDASLANLTYFKLGGPAEIFFKVEELGLLKEILGLCERERIPWTVVGGLSNVVVADSGVDGLVLQMACKAFELLENDEDKLVFRAEAGIKTSQLVSKSAQLNGSGLEGFIGVPGTLGGAIYNNAHYLEYLIGDYIEEVRAFHVKNEEDIIFSHEKCRFAYEQSIFQEDRDLVILSAKFSLKKAKPVQIKKKIVEAQARRLATQPLNYPSSGCIFRNPPNNDHLRNLFPQFAKLQFVPAGFLIDQAGLKNQQEGSIVVSEKHAAFLVNLADQLDLSPSSEDLKKLVKKIRAAVKEKFQVELEEEIFYLGND